MRNRAFRHPIEIVSVKTSSDALGNQIAQETLHHKCRANVNGIGGKEYFAAARPVEEGEATFEVRYCKKVAALNTTEYFILFRGERYDITYIDNYQFGNDTLKMRAKMKRGRMKWREGVTGKT